MTATLQERAPTRKDEHGGAPARRAVVRWAWRLYRREWRRQALVLCLLIVAIAATIVGLGATTNAAQLRANPTFGTADTLLTLPGSDPDVSGDMSALREKFGVVESIAHQSAPIPGSVASLDVRAEDPNGPYGHVMLRLDSGRYPTGTDEVAFTAQAAKTFDVHVGGQWSLNGRDLQVVGVVENPLNLLDQFALLAPGQASTPQSVSVLLNAGAHGLDSFRWPSHAGLSYSSRSEANEALIAAAVLVISTLGLVFIGLMAVAGFAVMAHRRQRALGMLGSLGATDRHLRLVVLANGAAVGSTAAIVGGVIGLVAWFAFAPTLESITNHRIDRFALPWWAIVTALLLAFVTAVAAAWWPARAVARMSAMTALSGRPPRPQPAHRFAVFGGVLFAGGIVLLAFADGRRVGFILGGTAATVIGLLFFAPLGIRLLAAVGRHSTIAVRLALRDLVRYQARSGAALGAITLAIGVAATIAINASASQTPNPVGNLAPNQLILHVSRGGSGDPLPALSPTQMPAAENALKGVATSLHASTLQLDEAYDATSVPVSLNGASVAPTETTPGQGGTASGEPSGYMTAVLANVTQLDRGTRISSMETLYVATPAVLARYGIAASDIASGVDIISARTDLAGLQLFDPMTPGPNATPDQRNQRGNEFFKPKIQVMSKLPRYSSGAVTLLTPHALQKVGLATLPAGWLLQTSHPLTKAQVDLATTAAARAGLYVETRRPATSLAPLRNGATAAGMLLALGVLAMTVGLIRSETSGDVRTLAATGAKSGTRRALTGATSGALAFLGAVIGTGGAYAALLAWYRSDLTPLGRLPVVDLVLILAGLPILASVGGWLLAGREPARIARQPLE
jgi:putative ABC transport system permease protein